MKALDSTCDEQPTAADKSRQGYRRSNYRPPPALAALINALEAEKAQAEAAGFANSDAIVEIDTGLIDTCFLSGYTPLTIRETIVAESREKELEKLSAIMVRPHPEKSGRYQIAYGHQRLRAAMERGIKVLAIIQQISDSEMAAATAFLLNKRTRLGEELRDAEARAIKLRSDLSAIDSWL
jgi:ParB family chromosome partitioning protein